MIMIYEDQTSIRSNGKVDEKGLRLWIKKIRSRIDLNSIC